MDKQRVNSSISNDAEPKVCDDKINPGFASTNFKTLLKAQGYTFHFRQDLQFSVKRYHFAAQITENILTATIVTKIEDTYPGIFNFTKVPTWFSTDVDQKKFTWTQSFATLLLT